MSSSAPSFSRDGVAVLQRMFMPKEVRRMRELVLSSLSTLPWLGGPRSGFVALDVIGDQALAPLHPVVRAVLENPALHTELSKVMNGSDYVFADMSELQVNRSVGWHRDILHSNEARLQRHDLWGETRYGMVRFIMYLQSHAEDDGALQLVPGSHLSRGCTLGGRRQPSCSSKIVELPARGAKLRRLRPAEGEAMLFDMRLMHRGHQRDAASYASLDGARISLQLTFGLRHNAITEEWREGDRERRARVQARMRLFQQMTATGLRKSQSTSPTKNDPPPAWCHTKAVHSSSSTHANMGVRSSTQPLVGPSGAGAKATLPRPLLPYRDLVTQLTSMMDLKSPTDALVAPMLRGRHVVIVGPAGYTQQSDLTQLVASADVVVRPNVKLTKDGTLQLPPRTTTRCDIVYHGGLFPGRPLKGVVGGRYRTIATPARIALSNESLGAFARHGVRALVLTSSTVDRLQHFACLAAPDGMVLATTTRWTTDARHARSCSRWRTGMVALIDVLRHAPRRLDVVGYDFYQTEERGFNGYYGEFADDGGAGHRQASKRHKAATAPRPGDSPHHDSAVELRIFRDCVLPRYRHVLRIDDHLEHVLQLATNASAAGPAAVNCTELNSIFVGTQRHRRRT